MKTDTQAKMPDHPTMADPQEGALSITINDREIVLTHAEYWIDEDGYTIRSREFDCFATRASFKEALDAFGRSVIEYALELAQRVEDGSATTTEQEVLQTLSVRLSRIYLEERKAQASRRQRRTRWPWRRDRRADDDSWRVIPA